MYSTIAVRVSVRMTEIAAEDWLFQKILHFFSDMFSRGTTSMSENWVLGHWVLSLFPLSALGMDKYDYRDYT